MPIQLRQICLVARELEPVIQDLTAILGINRCFVDPGVGKFGLENTLMPIGRNFLEVVAPVEEGTAGGRYLTRRNGDHRFARYAAVHLDRRNAHSPRYRRSTPQHAAVHRWHDDHDRGQHRSDQTLRR